MANFIGRTRELKLLGGAYRGPRSAFVPIYGRRRVGKSELILHFMQDKPGVYFLGKQASGTLQIREFLHEAALAIRQPLLAELRGDSWQQALLAAVNQWRATTAAGDKLILALDEFQWMATASPDLLSTLQHCWDRHWRDAGDVMLLLSGSYIGFMEREVLGSKSPLFGRRTAHIHLLPFGYVEAAQFHPRWSLVDRARAYFLVGGLPQYLLFLDQHDSIERNIEQNMLDPLAALSREPAFLIREELREVSAYHAVLNAIASGASGIAAIAADTGLPERSLHYYLQQLASLGYVHRRHPLDGSRANPRQVRYRIDDPLLRFWFRFVFPNQTYIRTAGPGRAFRDRVAPQLNAWFGSCFEDLCREALPLIYASEGVNCAFDVGEYWNRHTQIDVVGLREDHWTDIGECKWGVVRSAKALRAELDRKIGHFPNQRGATLGRRLFTRNKPAGKPGDERWHTLADLYALPGAAS